MQSTGITKAVLQRHTRTLTKVRSQVLSSYSSSVLLRQRYTSSLRYYWLPRKLTQLTVCFSITGRSPSKMVLSLVSLKKLGSPLYQGEVMSHTLILSKGQMMADSMREIETPVATPARVLEWSQPLNILRNSAIRQTLSGHLQADLLITRIELTAKPEQNPLRPFFWQISERAWRVPLFYDCIHVLMVSKGCSKGRETIPLSVPNTDISISLIFCWIAPTGSALDILNKQVLNYTAKQVQAIIIKYHLQQQMAQLKSTPITVTLSLLLLRAYSQSNSTMILSSLSRAKPWCYANTLLQNYLICWLVNASNRPSLPRMRMSQLSFSYAKMSGTALIIPGSPPYFFTFTSMSPMVLETLRLPGRMRNCRNSLICLNTPSCSLQILPPCMMILIFSPMSQGLWSLVSYSTFSLLTIMALLSPKLAVITLSPTTKHTTAQDPLLYFPYLHSQSSKNFSSHFWKAYFRACQGWFSSILERERKTAKLSFKYSAQFAPPWPSKMAYRSQVYLLPKVEEQIFEFLARQMYRSQWQLRFPCLLQTWNFCVGSDWQSNLMRLLAYFLREVKQSDLSTYGIFLMSVEILTRLQGCSLVWSRGRYLTCLKDSVLQSADSFLGCCWWKLLREALQASICIFLQYRMVIISSFMANEYKGGVVVG